ncbi:MAG: BLUF domain-containing protein [Acidimicrobiia bacterium]|nr:BLUF domain-containing protein [Acidimicrobiia bacterium]
MSTFSRPLSPEEISGIGTYASVRNSGDGVTGVLLTLGSVFFQIIEGEEGAIDDLYGRVLRDDRHTDIICLRTEQDAPDRLFPDWSMNVYDLDHIGGDVVDPLKLLLDRMSEAQHIIERYTQPAVSRIMTQGLNPLDIPLRKVDRLVLFADMVAFSTISDRLPIEDVSALANTYLEICSAGIARQHGEVTKFLGDGVMAYFDADGADAALQSCVDIQHELREIRETAPPHSRLRLLFSGFGLALGPVVEGSIGSSVKMDYTIIGEPVNSAARVEALTRKHDLPVLMTEAVVHATLRPWEIRYLGDFDIGRNTASPVHSLTTGAANSTGMCSAVADFLDVVATPEP